VTTSPAVTTSAMKAIAATIPIAPHTSPAIASP
jgi:hypothetical protein